MTEQQFTTGQRITGTARQELTKHLAARYQEGASIRALAEALGRSYGTTHRLLTESGVKLRSRGGSTRTGRR